MSKFSYDVDEDIKKVLDKYESLLWIPYNEFKEIGKMGKGASATVYKADWEVQMYTFNVALKIFKESEQNRFIKEVIINIINIAYLIKYLFYFASY